MKPIFFALFCIVSFVGACAQSKVVDFLSATVSVPIDGKISVTDVIYRDSKFDTIQERIAKEDEFKGKNINEKMGSIIDEMQLINYKSDTLYILSTYYLPDGSVSTIIKTNKGAFDLIYNADGECSLRSLECSYANIPKDEKESDFLLYKTIFMWDIDLLIRLIKSSGGYLGSEYWMSATRVILKDNQIAKKDIVNFKPTVRWHLE